jgi:hypothetical protein
MRYSARLRWWGVSLVIGVVLAACGGRATTQLPATLPPAIVTVYLAGTSTPGGAPVPTDAPGVATSTPAPTNAAVSATPQTVYGPDSYPANINPLTGETADPASLARMPIAAKIANYPYAVRPQSGLGLADLVFEHLAEAGVTRFTAVFLQNEADKIGSIRSARYIDTEISPMFGALLVTSGSSLGTMAHLRSNEWFLGENVWRLVSEETRYVCPPLCHETPDDTNTLFTSTKAVRAAVAGRVGPDARGESGFAFSEAVPAGGKPLTEVLIDYSSAAHVAWRYNPGGNRYTRWQEKDPTGELAAHIDAVTNQPITARNVVVLFVNYQNNFVPEDFRDGGNCGLEVQMWTAGPARVFRDGQMLEGRWHRDETTNWRLRLEDFGGQNLPLGAGNTWFGVVGLNAVESGTESTYSVMNRVVDTRSECPVPPTETPTLTPEGYVAPTETPIGFVASETPVGFVAVTDTPSP